MSLILTFSLEEVLLMIDLFTYEHSFSLQKMLSHVGYLWIIVVFLISCLDSHSDGTHSLQRIHWWASNVMLNVSKFVLMKKQSHLQIYMTASSGSCSCGKEKKAVKLFFTMSQCLTAQWSNAHNKISIKYLCVAFPRFHSLPQQMLPIMCKLHISLSVFLVSEMKKTNTGGRNDLLRAFSHWWKNLLMHWL